MSVNSEELAKAFRQWKKDLDERAKHWVKEHSEPQESDPLPEKETKES
jgi:hypothetical protein